MSKSPVIDNTQKQAAATDSVQLRTAQPFSAEIRPSSWMKNKLISSPSFSTGNSSPFKGNFGQDPMSSTRPVVPTPQTPVINLGGIQTKRAFNRAVGAAAGGGLGTIAGALAALGIGSFTDHKVTGDLIPPLSIGGGTLGAMAGAALGRNRKPSEGEVPQLPPTTVRGLLESLMQPEPAAAKVPNPGEIPIGKRSKRGRGDVGIGSKLKQAGLASVLSGLLGRTVARGVVRGSDNPAAMLGGMALGGVAAGIPAYYGFQALAKPTEAIGAAAHGLHGSLAAAAPRMRAGALTTEDLLALGLDQSEEVESEALLDRKQGRKKAADWVQPMLAGAALGAIPGLAIGGGMGWRSQTPDEFEMSTSHSNVGTKRKPVPMHGTTVLPMRGGKPLYDEAELQALLEALRQSRAGGVEKQAGPLGSILKGVAGFGKSQLDETPRWAKLIGPPAVGAGVGAAESYALGHDADQTRLNMGIGAGLGLAAGKVPAKRLMLGAAAAPAAISVAPHAASAAKSIATSDWDGMAQGNASSELPAPTPQPGMDPSKQIEQALTMGPGPGSAAPSKLQGYLTSLMERTGQTPDQLSSLAAGAGLGAMAGGLGSRKNRMRNALLGALAGGGGAALINHMSKTAEPVDPTGNNWAIPHDETPWPINTWQDAAEPSVEQGIHPELVQIPSMVGGLGAMGAGAFASNAGLAAGGAASALPAVVSQGIRSTWGPKAQAGWDNGAILSKYGPQIRDFGKGLLESGKGMIGMAPKLKKSAHDLGYGFCPVCGAPGIGCERSMDGNTHCANGHDYPHTQRVYPEQSSLDENMGTEKSAAYLEGQRMAAGGPLYLCGWCRRPQPCGCDARAKQAAAPNVIYGARWTAGESEPYKLPQSTGKSCKPSMAGGETGHQHKSASTFTMTATPHSPSGNLAKLAAEGRGGQVGESQNALPSTSAPRGNPLHKTSESVRQHIELPQNKESIQQVRSVGGGGTDAAKSDPAHCEKPTPPQGGALVGPAPAATRTKEAASPGAVSKAFGPSAPGAGSGIGPNQKSVLGPQGGGISKMPQVSGGGGSGSFATKLPSIGSSTPAAGPIQQLGGGNRDNDKMMMLPSGGPSRLSSQGFTKAPAPKMPTGGGMQFSNGNLNSQGLLMKAPAPKMPAAPPSNPKMHPGGGGQGNQIQMLKPGEADAMFAASRAKAQPVAGGGGGGGSAMGRLTGAAKAVPAMGAKALSGVQGMLGLGK